LRERLLDGLGSERAAGAFALKVIETTATAAGRRLAARLATDGGTAALCEGGDGPALPLPLDELAAREATVVGAAACHPDLYPELMALVVRGELRLAPEVIPLPFAELGAALDGVRSGRIVELPVLRPS
jgi:hypothetical protein